MADQKKMNDLLKWSIENSTTAPTVPPSGHVPSGNLNQEVLDAILGGPSDADLMRESMAAIKRADISVADKEVAFDNFEQLIEGIDNANNIAALKLWEPLVQELSGPEPKLRRMAAWCVGTAVQNNEKAQKSLVETQGGVRALVHLAVEDGDAAVRKKGIFALSSAVRNYQPALDELLKELREEFRPEGEVDAADMDAVDDIINKLREASAKKEPSSWELK